MNGGILLGFTYCLKMSRIMTCKNKTKQNDKFLRIVKILVKPILTQSNVSAETGLFRLKKTNSGVLTQSKKSLFDSTFSTQLFSDWSFPTGSVSEKTPSKEFLHVRVFSTHRIFSRHTVMLREPVHKGTEPGICAYGTGAFRGRIETS